MLLGQVARHCPSTVVKEHKDPTETEDGYDRIVCSVCGEILSEEIISATGHNWGDGVITKEATCVENGIITYTCKECSATYTESIPADPDNHVNVSTKKTDPTCTNEGIEITYCVDCGKELKKKDIPAIGHNWKESSSNPATCVAEGKSLFICDNCGDTKEEAIPVDPENHVAIQDKTEDATCTKDGKITTYCHDCGKVFKEIILPATGHTWDDGTVTTEPTCINIGKMTYTCESCGETQVEELPVDPDNHENITTETEDATCTENGVAVTYCKDCQTVLEQNSIPIKGHTEVKDHKDPTATENGYDRVVCSACGTVISETVIPATGEQKEATLVSGAEINLKMKYLSGTISKLPDSFRYSNSYHEGAGRDYGVFNLTDDIDKKIKAFIKSDEAPDISVMNDANIISTEKSKTPVYIWYDEGIIYWWSEDGTPSFGTDASGLFCSLQYLEDISGVAEWDTSNVKSMVGIFDETFRLLDFSAVAEWNVSKVTDMSYLFYRAYEDDDANYKVTDLSPLKNWNTSSLEYLDNAFMGLQYLTDLTPLAKWDVSGVKSMGYLTVLGTKKKPPKKVPVMLPSVDTAWIVPDVFPAVSRFFSFILVIIGGIIPKAIEEGRNNSTVPIIAPIFMLLITDARSPNMISDNTGIYRISTAAHNDILQRSF